MKFEKNNYKRYAKQHARRSPMGKNCLAAFLSGGAICAAGELLYHLFSGVFRFSEKESGLCVSLVLIFFAALFTGIGVFDKIAKHTGAGTLVPFTGFANAVASPAIDAKSEGYVLGVGAKMFTVAGPVLLYGTAAGAVWGLIFWLTARE
ncbi:MAG: stage V sporulation protein AC [Clostridia bacterium]|nr:stage V sporulation protein AC [Clostridia bacterium]